MAGNKVRVFIVEDQLESRKRLEELLLPFESIELVGSYGSAEDAFREVVVQSPQLIFLDVELPGKSGFEFLADLKQLDLQPCVIFTTAFDRYAIQAIKHAAFDYLLKPIDPDELAFSINKYLATSQKCSLDEKIDKLLEHVNPNNKIRFNTRQGFTLISPSQIIYCQADWNYTEIWLGKEKKEVVTMNIGKVMDLLPPDQYIRINRSVVINRTFIEKLNRKSRVLILKAGDWVLEFKVSGAALKGLKE